MPGPEGGSSQDIDLVFWVQFKEKPPNSNRYCCFQMGVGFLV